MFLCVIEISLRDPLVIITHPMELNILALKLSYWRQPVEWRGFANLPIRKYTELAAFLQHSVDHCSFKIDAIPVFPVKTWLVVSARRPTVFCLPVFAKKYKRNIEMCGKLKCVVELAVRERLPRVPEQ